MSPRAVSREGGAARKEETDEGRRRGEEIVVRSRAGSAPGSMVRNAEQPTCKSWRNPSKEQGNGGVEDGEGKKQSFREMLTSSSIPIPLPLLKITKILTKDSSFTKKSPGGTDNERRSPKSKEGKFLNAIKRRAPSPPSPASRKSKPGLWEQQKKRMVNIQPLFGNGKTMRKSRSHHHHYHRSSGHHLKQAPFSGSNRVISPWALKRRVRRSSHGNLNHLAKPERTAHVSNRNQKAEGKRAGEPRIFTPERVEVDGTLFEEDAGSKKPIIPSLAGIPPIAPLGSGERASPRRWSFPTSKSFDHLTTIVENENKG